jgi:pyruvate dehydrogenase E1 component
VGVRERQNELIKLLEVLLSRPASRELHVREALAAADELERGGIGADVVCLTSPDLIYRAVRAQQGLDAGEWWILERLFPSDRTLPVVTVIDAHSHTLAFLGQVAGVACTSLGVTEFGQSGDISDLYRHHVIDAESIVGAALDLL